MVNVLGLDIGGANTKVSLIRTRNGTVEEFKLATRYFPFWKRDIGQLRRMLSEAKLSVAGSTELDCISVTLTAELSDAYRTKREGVNHILDCVNQAYAGTLILVLDMSR